MSKLLGLLWLLLVLLGISYAIDNYPYKRARREAIETPQNTREIARVDLRD
jgi:hypothetical protein